ncbi:hypothetical protein GCM10023063_04860 [Arthrobacter methylotrophus]|uniref:Transposase for insertion sequence element IS21-like C-terminal domain-containing protein n=1 Tax=Arthrobacter methylotrophus TaxID=121291 RepID=A0ABV5USP8_9MICC
MENTVAHVATWIIAGLRQRQFTSLPELRAAIIERVAAYNAEPFQKRPGSRASVFAAEEQPLLTGLPAAAYEISTWVYGRRVARNGHVVWERNYYSAPFANTGTKVDLRITDRVIQAYRGTERLTSHLLLPEGAANEYRTNDADLPAGEKYRQWDPPRVREWAGRIGPAAVTVVNRIFESVPVDEQGLDAALAVVRGSPGATRPNASRKPAGLRWQGVCGPRGMRICSRSWPQSRTKPPDSGHHGMNRPNTADTSATPNTTQVVPSERDRYRNQTQAP